MVIDENEERSMQKVKKMKMKILTKKSSSETIIKKLTKKSSLKTPIKVMDQL